MRPLPYWIETPTKGMQEYFHLNPPIVIFDGFGKFFGFNLPPITIIFLKLNISKYNII